MSSSLTVRLAAAQDFERWLPLWQGYNQFYGRVGTTALPEEITRTTWARFFDPYEPVFALVAERQGRLVGLAHYLLHRSTTRLLPNCYMQDLFTDPTLRGQGIGKALIQAVYAEADRAGLPSVYWQTHETNRTAMKLYDQVAQRSGFIVYSRKV